MELTKQERACLRLVRAVMLPYDYYYSPQFFKDVNADGAMYYDLLMALEKKGAIEIKNDFGITIKEGF